MFLPVDENGEELDDARLAELIAEHEREVATPGFTGPTELDRATARAWAQATNGDYDWFLKREVDRRIRTMEHRQAREAEHLARDAKRSARSKRPLGRRPPPARERARPAPQSPTPPGSHGRYEVRRARWRSQDGVPRPLWRVRHAAWWWLHNLVVHPLLGLLPVAVVVRLHDWSSGRLARSLPPESPLPRIPSRWWWLVHNVGAHIAIGVWPCAVTFRWHDLTAKRMGVPGWV